MDELRDSEDGCIYYRTGELRPDADGDWVVSQCITCGAEALFEATGADYADVDDALAMTDAEVDADLAAVRELELVA